MLMEILWAQTAAGSRTYCGTLLSSLVVVPWYSLVLWYPGILILLRYPCIPIYFGTLVSPFCCWANQVSPLFVWMVLLPL